MPTLIKYIVYGLIIVLSAVIVGLILISPSGFEDTKSVYQGF